MQSRYGDPAARCPAPLLLCQLPMIVAFCNKSSHVTNPFMAAHRALAKTTTTPPRGRAGPKAQCVERYDNCRHEARWRLSFVFLRRRSGQAQAHSEVQAQIQVRVRAQQATAAGQESICAGLRPETNWEYSFAVARNKYFGGYTILISNFSIFFHSCR